jgi:hypothetical protein
MRLPRRSHGKEKRTVYVGSHEDKLSRIPRMHVDPDDDRQTREDRGSYRTIFDFPVPLPRFLRRGAPPKRRD